MIDFSKRIKKKNNEVIIDPVKIYNMLDRSSETGSLRPVQLNVLSKWQESFRDEKDVIIKLHTGAGKTLIGLLIAMSYINNNEGPAIYVCPNIYLMKQVCADAKRFGIPFCTITGTDLPNQFIQGKSILITYVQKVFNGLSIFGIGNKSLRTGCIILDDSHACIESMMNSCTIKIDKENSAYRKLLDLFVDELKGQGQGTLEDLLHHRSNTVMPIPYWSWYNHLDSVTKILSANAEEHSIKFAWPMLKDRLKDCSAYISDNKIEISPMCLPIEQYGVFSNANHRILMSATTQEDTLFIKGLDFSIKAIENPIVDNDHLWAGEKMVLIPDEIYEEFDSNQFINTIVTSKHNFGIAVLTPSFDKAKKYELMGATLVNKTDTSKDMYNTLQDYATNHKDNTIVFANRYDGIDLPDDMCRILIIDSLPYYDSLSDRYEEMCRQDAELMKIKVIQRIEQGLGRSVRGEKDYSVIIIVGSDLVKCIRSCDNQRLFSSQTKKQIEIGFELVDISKESLKGDGQEEIEKLLISTISQCIARDNGWKEYYASMMDETENTTRNKGDLYALLQKEREAYQEVIAQNYNEASQIIQEIIDMCTNELDKGWYLQQKAKLQYHVDRVQANKTQIAAFKKNIQLLKPQSGVVYNRIKYPIDCSRNEKIIKIMSKYSKYEQLMLHIDEILSNLNLGVEAEKAENAENAFYKVGELLGLEVQRPDKQIRKGPDVLWCLSQKNYIVIECKTEVLSSRSYISKSEAGQMEEHMAWFESEYGMVDCCPVLVITTPNLASDAYFSHPIKILTSEGLDRFRRTIKEFFREFKGYDLRSLTIALVKLM